MCDDLMLTLREAVELLEDIVTYVPEYFREKWDYDAEIKKLRDLLP